MPDFECTWWPDIWFGTSITDCCIAHDLGGSDTELLTCVAEQHWSFLALGAVMFVGLKLLGPVYRVLVRY